MSDRRLPGAEGATPAVAVRRAGIEDAAVIHALLLEFNGEALSPDALVARMRQVGRLETAFLAEQSGVPAGLLVVRIVPTLSDPQDWAEITELYVRPAFRRQGVGTALVRAAVRQSQRQGCVELNLLVDPANVEAHAFYKASGFCCDSWGMRRGV